MLEVCVDNLSSVNAAVEGGAQRIELCSALSEGGLTPSVGFLKMVKRTHPNLTVFAMLRPRCGNFVYSQLEMDCILEDMTELNANGVDGFVFGALTDDRKIDEDHCTLVKQHSNALPLTFHRAIDITDTTVLTENVAKIERLGFNRILTSGLQRTAELGMENIAKMQQCSKNIIVVPGAGINLKNVETILSTTGCKEFHSSASIKTIDDAPDGDIDFGKIMRTDSDIVRNLVKIGQQFL
ncbi:copper homeostasis protein cutC homolog isoform X2 [Bradysia coprophila]|nr:copper homeostasis protein cutC homolog isoform X2 [Bradysia coprophila]XP_037036463.1 copper homeostasis protein cutC homolog isoform X2 [Bradysia coprophila]XP_037036464.1 copper homeostasis protein cutC homolog isoform X2 [Bradysia coprophila]XP_037036465.1 copper homeostasis protein cutC homolog isoform X2 [Bradysia coprophila]